MLKMIVIAMLVFSVGCFSDKNFSDSSNQKASEAEAKAKKSVENLKQKEKSEAANYESILSEIETMNSEKRRTKTQNNQIIAEMKKGVDSAFRGHFAIKLASNKKMIGELDQKLEEKRLAANIANQNERIASFQHKLTQLDKESSNYEINKKNIEFALSKAKAKVDDYQNEKGLQEELDVARKKSMNYLADHGELDKELEKDVKRLEDRLIAVKNARSKALPGESTDFSVSMEKTKKDMAEAVKAAPGAGVDVVVKYSKVAAGFVMSRPEWFAKIRKGDGPNVDGLYSLKDLNLSDKNALTRVQKEMTNMSEQLDALNKEILKIREAKKLNANTLMKVGVEKSFLYKEIKKVKEEQGDGYMEKLAEFNDRMVKADSLVKSASIVYEHIAKHEDGINLSHEAASDMYNRLEQVETYLLTRDAVKQKIKMLSKDFSSSGEVTKQETKDLKKYIERKQKSLAKYTEKIEAGKSHASIADELYVFVTSRDPASVKKTK